MQAGAPLSARSKSTQQRVQQLPPGQPAGGRLHRTGGGEVRREERVGQLPRDDRLRHDPPLVAERHVGELGRRGLLRCRLDTGRALHLPGHLARGAGHDRVVGEQPQQGGVAYGGLGENGGDSVEALLLLGPVGQRCGAVIAYPGVLFAHAERDGLELRPHRGRDPLALDCGLDLAHGAGETGNDVLRTSASAGRAVHCGERRSCVGLVEPRNPPLTVRLDAGRNVRALRRARVRTTCRHRFGTGPRPDGDGLVGGLYGGTSEMKDPASRRWWYVSMLARVAAKIGARLALASEQHLSDRKYSPRGCRGARPGAVSAAAPTRERSQESPCIRADSRPQVLCCFLGSGTIEHVSVSVERDLESLSDEQVLAGMRELVRVQHEAEVRLIGAGRPSRPGGGWRRRMAARTWCSCCGRC